MAIAIASLADPATRMALRAVRMGDQQTLVVYTREIIRLCPARLWWPWVAEALWETSHLIDAVGNQAGYIRDVAKRLRHRANASLFGPQTIRDRRNRRIGVVHIGGYVREEDGSVDEALLARASDVPIVAEQPCRRVCAVVTETDDERQVQALQIAGRTRREIADRLGWTLADVDRIAKCLERRRRADCPGAHTRTK